MFVVVFLHLDTARALQFSGSATS